jgi:hypothetical protein
MVAIKVYGMKDIDKDSQRQVNSRILSLKKQLHPYIDEIRKQDIRARIQIYPDLTIKLEGKIDEGLRERIGPIFTPLNPF